MIAVVCSARVGEFLREIGILPFLGSAKIGKATETQWILDSKLFVRIEPGIREGPEIRCGEWFAPDCALHHPVSLSCKVCRTLPEKGRLSALLRLLARAETPILQRFPHFSKNVSGGELR